MTTTQRSVRVDDDRWARFVAACHRLGTDASKRLNQHIDNDLAEHGDEGSK